jgi:hypothetical protein
MKSKSVSRSWFGMVGSVTVTLDANYRSTWLSVGASKTVAIRFDRDENGRVRVRVSGDSSAVATSTEDGRPMLAWLVCERGEGGQACVLIIRVEPVGGGGGDGGNGHASYRRHVVSQPVALARVREHRRRAGRPHPPDRSLTPSCPAEVGLSCVTCRLSRWEVGAASGFWTCSLSPALEVSPHAGGGVVRRLGALGGGASPVARAVTPPPGFAGAPRSCRRW